MLTLAPVWVRTRCGTCTQTYVVNARSAPVIGGKRYCRACWDRSMRLRTQLDLVVYDCPEGTWPDPCSPDPSRRGEGAVALQRGAKLF